jgi:hypothetical protein
MPKIIIMKTNKQEIKRLMVIIQNFKGDDFESFKRKFNLEKKKKVRNP